MRLCYDAIVRTTLDIDNDAYQVAKTVAREQNRSLGSVVSDFILGKLGRASTETDEDEDEVFPTFRCTRPVTSEDVRSLEDE